MDKVKVTRKSYSVLQIESDDGIAWELRDHFSFFVPGYKFMPMYRNKMWDGKIKIFEYNTRTLPAGLYYDLEKFCKNRGYDIEPLDSPYGMPNQKTKVDPKKVWAFIQDLNLHSKGKKIEVRDYQFNAICEAIRDNRTLLLSPTGSGKSLIIYCLIRWFASIRDDKILVIVPTTSLVEQMYSDFGDYSSEDNIFNVHQNCHRIYSGKEKTNVHERIFISTWQSIYKLPPTWFAQFGAIFGDEAHGFVSKSLTKSMEKATNARYRIGTTGTLDGTKTHEMVLRGVFGPINKVTTTKKLQDEDTLAQLDIKMLQLIYPEQTRKDFGKQTYQHELDWIVRHEPRNKFITNLALSLEGNTLILFQFVDKHGKVLYQMISQKADGDRKIFYVSGETEASDREAIRKIIEHQKDSITVASSGVFSTGINIKNLHNLISTSPSKSQIKILQGLGRTLRKSDNGVTTRMYDLVDYLDYGPRKNYALLHAEERVKIYQREQFNITYHKVYMK